MLGVAAAVALGYGLWSSRKLPFVPDIGTLLADRNVAGYTFSMSHFFDLTAASFAALRLPAALAAAALLLGPAIAWSLRRKRHDFEATVSVAFTSAVFLIAAHIALVRFEPMLSSRAMADTINGTRWLARWRFPLEPKSHFDSLWRPVLRIVHTLLHPSSGALGQWPRRRDAVGIELS